MILYFSMNLHLVTFTKNSLQVPEQSKFKKHEKTIFLHQIRSKMRNLDLKKSSFTSMCQVSFFLFHSRRFELCKHFFTNFPFLTLATLKICILLYLQNLPKKAWFDTFALEQKTPNYVSLRSSYQKHLAQDGRVANERLAGIWD